MGVQALVQDSVICLVIVMGTQASPSAPQLLSRARLRPRQRRSVTELHLQGPAVGRTCARYHQDSRQPLGWH